MAAQKESSGIITITAKSTSTISHTFTVPSGYQKIPLFAYIVTTGWSGVVCQGTLINPSTGMVTFTLFNVLDTSVNAEPQMIAIFMKD